MDDLHAWVAFSQLDSLNLSQKHTLLNQFGSVNAVLDVDMMQIGLQIDTPEAKNKRTRLRDQIDEKRLEQTLKWVNVQASHRLISFSDPHYPDLLKQISTPPLLLYACGKSELLNDRQIAIVGSRKATLAGKQLAEQFAEGLCDYGLTITSGMALGIDRHAHKGALKCGGNTIAVLGTGIDICYPRSNQALYEQLHDQGLLISEFNLSAPPLRTHFPQRNRLISGLSLGTLVVEATQRSGSLITARFALQQNREIFAIPGSILSRSACGCLSLIQQGAKLTRNVDDILSEFSEFSATSFNNKPSKPIETGTEYSAQHHQLLELMSDVPLSFDKLISQSGLTIDQLCSILLDLELGGIVEKLPGNQYLRTTRQLTK